MKEQRTQSCAAGFLQACSEECEFRQ